LGKVCTTIAAKTSEEMGRKAALAFALGSDLVEFRVDMLDEAPSSTVEGLRRFARKAIITVRRKDEGGGFMGSEAERLALISELSGLKPLYVDVELSTVVENPEWFGSLERAPKKITSWHDFAGTPGLSALRKARKSAGAHGDVVKIVTTAKKVEDNGRVLRLYEDEPEALIAFCMGEAGTASRLASLQLGSPVTYAALPNEPVAPGQLSVSTVAGLKKLWERRGW
jgi:3-dehydroquinate dehydratase type I